mgnify:CR=1 FL=1
MHCIINEGSAKLKVPVVKKISKEMDVFYNPAMAMNRDISILLLGSINKKNMQIADPLAASGVRSIRFLKELGSDKIKKICVNDNDAGAVKSIRENLALNKIFHGKNQKIEIKNEDANLFLLSSSGFDYIDIDPFGSPNYFLDSACKRLSRSGVLAVTATDTSALCGTFPKACQRKYWAVPKKDAIMHETGLRILIRKAQLVAGQYDKALVPIFSYSREHYMRAFLINDKGKSKVDDILGQHAYFNGAGPLWTGNLWDEKLAGRIHGNALKNKLFGKNKPLVDFLSVIKTESGINAVGFYDLHDICKKNKIKTMQKKDAILDKIKKLGCRASETHFKGAGLRSDISYSKLASLLGK